MKVLILANNSVGLYKFRKELLEALLANKHEVFISLPNGDFIDDMQQMGCHFIETEISRHGTNPLTDLALETFPVHEAAQEEIAHNLFAVEHEEREESPVPDDFREGLLVEGVGLEELEAMIDLEHR